MLSVLNTYCHGYVAVPILATSVRRGLFDGLDARASRPFDALVERTGANAGYLRVVLRALRCLGWVDEREDGYRLGAQAEPGRVPCDLAELYDFPFEALFVAGPGRDLLVKHAGRLAAECAAPPSALTRLTEGALLLPLVVGLERRGERDALARGEAPLAGLGEELRACLTRLFAAQAWSEPGGGAALTRLGREVFERASVMAIAASYRPMLARLDELLCGDPLAVIHKDAEAAESHVDRTLNVQASGHQHRRYFAEAEALLVELFDRAPLESQPGYIADMGCGDGTLLRHAYHVVQERTARGARLQEFPLTLVGVDCSPEALRETEKTLAGLPHVTLAGDVAQPQRLLDDLAARGLGDPRRTLHVRSFLDHDFRSVREDAEPARASDALSALDAAYVDRHGRQVAPADVLAAWRRHLRRWAQAASDHGLLILEAHCLPVECVRDNFAASESFYFDTLHALSQQYLISAEAYLTVAASVGLFPRAGLRRFPKTLPFCRITLTHFEKRDYVVRPAEADDLPALVELERLCWPEHLRAPEAVLRERLRGCPQGQLVLELGGRVAAVIYSQRVESVRAVAASRADETASLRVADGPVVQLIALNVDPALQHRRLGDQLLELTLQRCGLLTGVRHVAGVTRCKAYDRDRGVPLEEHVRARDERGSLVDPMLNYHESHGATIGEVVRGYRPQDTANEGCGVLVVYDLHDRDARHDARRGPGPAERAAGARAGVEELTEGMIRACLGPRREAAYAPSRPLMEMGLDSADLLELTEHIRHEFGLEPGPAFFFEHSTPAKVVAFLSDALSPRPAPEVERPAAPVVRVSRPGARAADVAIVGVACRLPGGNDAPESLWAFLQAGRSAIGDIPAERFTWPRGIDPRGEHAGIDKAGLLDDLRAFDAAFFRIAPAEAASMDPQQRILLELAWRCLDDAGYSGGLPPGGSTGVFVGASGSDYATLLAARPTEAHFATGASMAILPNRLSYFFDLRGPSVLVDTACSSSLVAVHQAVESLRRGECDGALVGGVNVICHPGNSVAYYRAGMLSPRGRCATFDERADGYVRAEGAVVMLLRPLERALEDRDQIYAVIKGTACNHGGESGGLTVPNPKQQARLLRQAWEQGQIEPGSIGFIETHGTGTPLGDPIEIEGIREALAAGRAAAAEPREGCGLGALKTNLGHLEAAAGLAGLLKAALSLRHAELVRNHALHRLNPRIQLKGSSLYPLTDTRPWPTPAGRPRRAAVSSFGIGGANAHVVLEEHAPARDEDEAAGERPLPFVLSAKTEDALYGYAGALLRHLEAGGRGSLACVAYTLSRRAGLAERLALVAASRRELIEKLGRFVARRGAAAPAPAVEGLHRGTVRERMQRDPAAPAGGAGVDELAARWVRGAPVDWEPLWRVPAGGRGPRVVSLPAYPFDTRQRFWLSDLAPRARAAASAPRPQPVAAGGTRAWLASPRWLAPRPLFGPAPAERHAGVLLLSTIELALTPVLRGSVRHHVALPDTGDSRDAASWTSAYRACMDRVRASVKRERPSLCVLLSEAGDGLAGMLHAALLCAGREIGFAVHWYAWDDDLPHAPDRLSLAALDDALHASSVPGAKRLRSAGGVLQVEERAWVPEPLEPPAQPALRHGGSYWITGGRGGLGRHLAAHLAREHAARVVLCGRSELRPDEAQALERIGASSGGSIRYRVADCASAPDMQALLAWTLAEQGSLDGVIHAAGVTRDHSLFLSAPEDTQAILRPKVEGALVVDEVTRDCALDFFVTFSSLSAVLGNHGQADYAAANAFLQDFARRRRVLEHEGARSGATVNVHWPYWEDGGLRLDEEQAARLGEAHGTVPLPTPEGLLAFEAVVARAAPEIAVFHGREPRTRAEPAAAAPSEAPATHDVLAAVAGITARVLALPADQLERDKHLADYGIDSIMLQALAKELNARFGLDLSALDLHRHPTVDALARLVAGGPREQPERPAPAAPAAVDGGSTDDDVAIVGVSLRVPGAATLQELWRTLLRDDFRLAPYPERRWNALPPRWTAGRRREDYLGGFLEDVDAFDARLFETSPREAMLMDPQHRLALMAVWEAIEDAGYEKAGFTRRPTSVYLAIGPGDYAALADGDARLDEFRGRGVWRYMGANRISHFFDLRGASETVDTACSSVFVAVDRACAALRSGRSEQAVVAGVHLNLDPGGFDVLAEQGLLSRMGRAAPFDETADGYTRTEGVGAVILKPLRTALEDGDHVHAVIKGVDVWHAGKAMGLTAPNEDARAGAQRRCGRRPGLHRSPRDGDAARRRERGGRVRVGVARAGARPAPAVRARQRQVGAGAPRDRVGHRRAAQGDPRAAPRPGARDRRPAQAARRSRPRALRLERRAPGAAAAARRRRALRGPALVRPRRRVGVRGPRPGARGRRGGAGGARRRAATVRALRRLARGAARVSGEGARSPRRRRAGRRARLRVPDLHLPARPPAHALAAGRRGLRRRRAAAHGRGAARGADARQRVSVAGAGRPARRPRPRAQRRGRRLARGRPGVGARGRGRLAGATRAEAALAGVSVRSHAALLDPPRRRPGAAGARRALVRRATRHDGPRRGGGLMSDERATALRRMLADAILLGTRLAERQYAGLIQNPESAGVWQGIEALRASTRSFLDSAAIETLPDGEIFPLYEEIADKLSARRNACSQEKK
jgi:polyketide synthase PksN